MAALVDESTARCLENRKLLADTRYRIASSRRLLNPGRGISGSSDETLRQAIRSRPLVALLRGLGIAHAEIVTACHVLTIQPHYVI